MLIVKNKFDGSPCFSLKNRLLRVLWGLIYFSLFRFSPRPLHFWRSFLLRLFGATVGKKCHIYPSVKIWAPWNLVLGQSIGIGDRTIIYSMDKITIKDYVVISQGAHLCAGSHDVNSPSFQLITLPIVIERYVWICAESFINPGVSVAEGSVIGARGVVAKSIVEPWCIWAGVPVKKIGLRNKSIILKE